MRLKVNEGWEPGITWDGKLYAPGDTFEIDDDAGQFLADGSAVEARTNPKRRAPMFCARPWPGGVGFGQYASRSGEVL